MRNPDIRPGDIVLVRGEVRPHGCVKVGTELLNAGSLDVVHVEQPVIKVEDRVLADGHLGTVVGLCNDYAWVMPDALGAAPSTFSISQIRRLAPENGVLAEAAE